MAVPSQCHYCGSDLDDRGRGSYDQLRRHLTTGCETAPEAVRQAHQRGCATGNCDR